MKSALLAAVAATALLSATAAQAQQAVVALPPGTYVRLDAGYDWAMDANLKDRDGAGPNCTTCDGSHQQYIGTAGMVDAGIGYRISPLFRTDVTLSYRGGFHLHDYDSVGGQLGSNISSIDTMLNGYIDLPVGALSPIKPYVGAGLGWAHNHMGTIGYAYAPGAVQVNPSEDSDNLAAQLMVGAGVDVAPNLTLDVGYKYFNGGALLGGRGVASGNAEQPYYASGLKGHLVSNELSVGLRYGF